MNGNGTPTAYVMRNDLLICCVHRKRAHLESVAGVNQTSRPTVGELRPRHEPCDAPEHNKFTEQGDVVVVTRQRSARLRSKPISVKSPLARQAPVGPKRQKFGAEIKAEALSLHDQGVPPRSILEQLRKSSGKKISPQSIFQWTRKKVITKNQRLVPSQAKVPTKETLPSKSLGNDHYTQHLPESASKQDEPSQGSHASTSSTPPDALPVANQPMQQMNIVHLIKCMIRGQSRPAIIQDYQTRLGQRITNQDLTTSMQLYNTLQDMDVESLSEQTVVQRTGIPIDAVHKFRSLIGSWLYHRNYPKQTIHRALVRKDQGKTIAEIRGETGMLQRDILPLVEAYNRLRSMQYTGENRRPLEPASRDPRCVVLQQEFALDQNKALTPQALENLWEYVRKRDRDSDRDGLMPLSHHIALNQGDGSVQAAPL